MTRDPSKTETRIDFDERAQEFFSLEPWFMSQLEKHRKAITKSAYLIQKLRSRYGVEISVRLWFDDPPDAHGYYLSITSWRENSDRVCLILKDVEHNNLACVQLSNLDCCTRADHELGDKLILKALLDAETNPDSQSNK